MRPMYSMCAGDWLSLDLSSGGGGIRLWLRARLCVCVIGMCNVFWFCDRLCVMCFWNALWSMWLCWGSGVGTFSVMACN